jgi:hypothetical protein
VNLILNEDKCTFAVKTFTGLGHKITPGKVYNDSKRIDSIMAIPQPKSFHDLHSFLGLINQVRDHIRHYADLTARLLNLLKQERQNRLAITAGKSTIARAKLLKQKPSRTFGPEWTDQDVKSFEVLRSAIAHAPCISFIDTGKPIVITMDASTYGVGSALYQPNYLGEPLTAKNLVTFRSHSLKQYQKGYANSAFKLELWALVQSLNDYKDYVWGRSFTVYTDHQALQVLNHSTTNRHMKHWLDVIQEYNFNIIHIPGVTNVLADALSRVYPHIWGIPETGVLGGLSNAMSGASGSMNGVDQPNNHTLFNLDWEYPKKRKNRKTNLARSKIVKVSDMDLNPISPSHAEISEELNVNILNENIALSENVLKLLIASILV